MAIATGRMALSFLAAALAAGSLQARLPQDNPRATAAAERLLANRAQLGLDADHAFLLRDAHSDQLGQTHAHFQQTYKGVKVWGGDAITHTGKDGAELPLTNALLKGIQLNVTPALGAAEALAAAQQDLAPKGPYAYAPTTELVVYPEMAEVVRKGRPAADLNADDVTRQVLRYSLAYHIHTELENDQDGIRHTDYLVDAHTGAILKSWNTLHTTAATGTGNSQYNGTVSLPTNYTGSTYELRDTTRGTGGSFGNNVVTNMAHASTSSTATGTLYTDADNTWGDGANYVEGSSTTAANGETAAVDAMFGMIKSWDFYKNVYGRNGIDGTGTATYSRVHIGNGYDNAFWSDSCFCMTYGDGTSFTTLTALDVAGHEMSHGVCARTANLTYSGESGGLNEANSDIFGTMIEFYARGGSGTTIGNTGGNWTIGEQLATNPLRWMYKPSLDGSSPDAWSSTIGSLDVHYSSGPMNRCFYFLSQGATTTGNTSTTYLPSGMTGVGNDKASAIWFRALTVYLTSSSNYAAARTAAINAAKDLYGAGGAEEQAVWNAFHGINVGSAWTSSDTTAPTVSASESGTSGTITFSATASDNVGVTKVEFYVDGALKGSDTTSPYSLSFDSTTLTNGTHTLTAKAYDAAGNVGTSTGVSFSVSNATSGAELILNGGFESGATSWTQTTGVIGTYTGEPAHTGSYDAWMCGYGSAHTDYVYQQIAIPTTATGTLTFWLHVDTAETTTTTAYDTMKVQVLNTSGTVLATLATYSNLNKGTGYTQKSLSLSAYKGQTIRLRFYAVEDSSLQTSFVVDDVSVK
ncbi:M4 family metallopeptidase [Geothrix fermentans]|uniref:M4 family metallopeptidase n=1 Tax=Geothrix fermentans TaxID=44676 RepID=UPI00041042FA|nr:M4 family metallopeptidase [Geothrix fermentans]